MKTISLHFTILFTTFAAHAQWQQNIRLTNDKAISQTSYNNAWCIGVSGDTIHVVWYDDRDGNEEIYYKRSMDGGITWDADVRLTNDSAGSNKPAIAVSGAVIHIVWVDGRDGNDEIYYKRSPNAGKNWTNDIRLTNDTADSWHPSITAMNSDVHVVWEDKRNGGVSDEIFYKQSKDGGKNWGADVQLTFNPSFSRYASIAMNGQDLHIVWFDDREGNYEIFYKQSSDGGNNWNTDVRLTNDTASSISPSIALSGSTIHVLWTDYRNGNEDIFYKRSLDGGQSWQNDVQLTNDLGKSTKPSVAAEASEVHVVWYDSRDGNEDIYYNHSLDGGNSWGIDEALTANTGNSFLPSIKISKSILHVVWFDFSDGNREIYYKQYKPIGTTVGIDNLTNNNSSHQFNIYPNPVVDNLFIYCNQLLKDQTYSLSIRDLMGKEILNETIQYDRNICNLTSLQNGIYLVEIKDQLQLFVTKIIVEH